MTDRAKERMMKQMRTELGKQPTTVAEWLVAKTKFPKEFRVDKEGNLVIPPIKLGDSEQILVVTPEVPAPANTINEYFTKKRESLKDLEEKYTSAKRNLQDVITGYKAGLITVADVLDANHNVHTAECGLNAASKLPRTIQDLTGSLQERDLSLQHYADRSIADKVSQVQYTTFPWQAFWTTGTNAAIAIEAVTEEGKEQDQEQNQPKVKRVFSKEQLAIIAARRKAASSGTK
jgi:hypothetical protein